MVCSVFEIILCSVDTFVPKMPEDVPNDRHVTNYYLCCRYHDNCCARRLYSVRSGPSCDLLGDEMYKVSITECRT